jgi:hypothetical protein
LDYFVKGGTNTVLWKRSLSALALRKRTPAPTATEVQCYAAEIEKVAKIAGQRKSV